MFTLSDIRSRVRTRFEASSSNRWSDADVNAAINDGIAELSEATRYYERWASIELKAGRTYYDLRARADTLLSVTAVQHEPGIRWLTAMTKADIISGYQLWEQSAGNPIGWFTRGLWWLGIWPRPASDPDQFLRVYYTAVAPALTDDGHIPDQLPDEFVPALEEYALYELQQREGETDKALYWWGQYKQREATLEQYMANRVTTARTGTIGRA